MVLAAGRGGTGVLSRQHMMPRCWTPSPNQVLEASLSWDRKKHKTRSLQIEQTVRVSRGVDDPAVVLADTSPPR